MSHEAVAAVTALIELGMIAQDDVVKCLKKALSEPEPQRTWFGLTDEEFQLIYDMGRTPAGMMEMVEAKLKQKNTEQS